MNPTVLVIDDEMIIQRLVTHTLKPLNIEVLSAMDGQSALDMARTHRLDLLLVDINLPDTDGFTLIQDLQQIPDVADVPMIAFTARNDPSDETHARALGAKGFLYKPFSTGELREMVTSFIAP